MEMVIIMKGFEGFGLEWHSLSQVFYIGGIRVVLWGYKKMIV
jgi:hypothetical protein